MKILSKKKNSPKRSAVAEAPAALPVVVTPHTPPVSPLAGITSQPRYGSGVRYDSGVQYAVGDAPPIVPGNAKAVQDLYNLNDPAFTAYTETLLATLSTSVYITNPNPTIAAMQTALTSFSEARANAKSLMDAAKEATQVKDQMRANLENLLRDLQNSVQTASQGDAAVILSAGMAVKRPPTRATKLPFPTGLAANPGDVTGTLVLTWEAVAGSMGYLLQCAEVTDNVPGLWSTLKRTSARTYVLPGLTAGKTYAFQAAALGGKDGQSDWCPFVTRICA
ncbi:MAG: fibronectin type III domain-containing protein [Verrucomicrobiaceae bacterium]|nr:fibronectin type III domain-containing protein [Verrucomicrobiaceae bacterium]